AAQSQLPTDRILPPDTSRYLSSRWPTPPASWTSRSPAAAARWFPRRTASSTKPGQSARGVFIIDPEGIVRHEVVHDDRVGRSVDEILRVLTALQSPGRTFAQFDAAKANC